ncbi:hypothetical protein ACQJBY_005768 [Aegilops geniculata]
MQVRHCPYAPHSPAAPSAAVRPLHRAASLQPAAPPPRAAPASLGGSPLLPQLVPPRLLAAALCDSTCRCCYSLALQCNRLGMDARLLSLPCSRATPSKAPAASPTPRAELARRCAPGRVPPSASTPRLAASPRTRLPRTLDPPLRLPHAPGPPRGRLLQPGRLQRPPACCSSQLPAPRAGSLRPAPAPRPASPAPGRRVTGAPACRLRPRFRAPSPRRVRPLPSRPRRVRPSAPACAPAPLPPAPPSPRPPPPARPGRSPAPPAGFRRPAPPLPPPAFPANPAGRLPRWLAPPATRPAGFCRDPDAGRCRLAPADCSGSERKEMCPSRL